jgi:hypothetical protein
MIMAGGQFTITYKGTVVGEEWKFRITIGGMGDGELTAKGAK